MKQAKSISTGKGIYSCSLLLSKETGKITAAKDKSCAAGKRGFCKHIVAQSGLGHSRGRHAENWKR